MGVAEKRKREIRGVDGRLDTRDGTGEKRKKNGGKKGGAKKKGKPREAGTGIWPEEKTVGNDFSTGRGEEIWQRGGPKEREKVGELTENLAGRGKHSGSSGKGTLGCRKRRPRTKRP